MDTHSGNLHPDVFIVALAILIREAAVNIHVVRIRLVVFLLAVILRRDLRSPPTEVMGQFTSARQFEWIASETDLFLGHLIPDRRSLDAGLAHARGTVLRGIYPPK